MGESAIVMREEVILLSLYGNVQRLEGRRWRCECNGTAWTVILIVLVVLAATQTLLVTAGHFGHPPWYGLGPLSVTLGLAGFTRWRHRRMGVFLLDAEAGRLVQTHGEKVLGEWPLADVTFTTSWDWYRKAKTLQHWLIAKTPDGRRLRIANGGIDQLNPLLDELRSWGLRVA